MDSYDITASALTAQRLRMDAISSNLANVNTTRREDGSLGAYRRRNVVFAPLMAESSRRFIPKGEFIPGGSNITAQGGLAMRPAPGGVSISADGRPMLHGLVSTDAEGIAGVQVMGIETDTETPMRLVYDPSHPDANEKGYVEMPNVNVVTEMVDMISASRAYEANVTALQSTKNMAQAALEL